MGGSIRGVVAVVRWAYYDAARLEGYLITRDEHGWRASGRVVWANTFNLAQQPLFFVAPHHRGAWEWPILECELTNGQLRARLGVPDERTTDVRTPDRRDDTPGAA